MASGVRIAGADVHLGGGGEGEVEDYSAELNLTPAQVAELRRVFNEIDIDGSGTLDYNEISSYLRNHGESDEVCHQWTTMFLAFTSVIPFLFAPSVRMLLYLSFLLLQEAIRKIYERIDVDGSGEVDFEEFVLGMARVRECLCCPSCCRVNLCL